MKRYCKATLNVFFNEKIKNNFFFLNIDFSYPIKISYYTCKNSFSGLLVIFVQNSKFFKISQSSGFLA